MKISWRRKLLYATLTTVLFFAVLEGGLYLVGLKPVTDTKDPFVGFSSHIPLFVPMEDKPELLTTAPAKTPWFNPQTFPREKPKGAFRIVCLGGSTTYGRPFRDATSFCGWLREYLHHAEPDRKWEVINAGGVSYASYRVANVMEEMAKYEPDLFIVYTAQNEFLEWRTYDNLVTRPEWTSGLLGRLSTTRTWALVDRVTAGLRTPAPAPKRYELPAEVDEMLNHTVGPTSYRRDVEWREQVLSHFRVNLDRMATIAEECGARMMYVTPASNLKDCSPFRSDVGDNVTEEQSREVDDLRDMARTLAAEGQLDAAIESLLLARDIDPQLAILHFELGQLQFQNADYAHARPSLLRALKEDVCPLRAGAEAVNAIRETAKRRGALLVDFEGNLTVHCIQQYEHACLGAELFLDHVHPTIEAHQLLGEWIYGELRRAEIVKTPLTDPLREAVAAKVESLIDETDHGVALRNLAKVLHWAGKFDEAGPLALKAIDRLGDDFASTAVAADCLREMGRTDEAIRYYQKAIQLDATFYQGYMRLGAIASDRGDYATAKELLDTGLLLEPGVAFAQYDYGFVLLQLGEYRESIKALTTALELAPGEPDTLYFLGRAHRELKEFDAAAKWLRACVDETPDDAQAQYELGIVLEELGDLSGAKASYDAALQVRPDFEEAEIRRDDLAEKLGGKES